MVVVQVRNRGESTWRRLVFSHSFWIGSDPSCEVHVAHAERHHAQIVLDGPDARLEIQPASGAILDRLPVDPTFLHVLHVGNVLEVRGCHIAFELVDGHAADVERYLSGRGKHILDDTEWAFIEALRENPDDAGTLDVYADWLDQHERPLLAEQIRLQRLRDAGSAPDNPSAFQSKWLSAQPAAVALRLQDLAPFAEPWWRALVARCRILGCGDPACPRWQGMQPSGEADRRACRRCHRDVHFCWSRDDVRERGRRRELAAVDPGLAIHDPISTYGFADRPSTSEITTERAPVLAGDD